MYLEESIRRFAHTSPERVAVVDGERFISYSTLWQMIEERREQLQSSSLRPHRPFVFRTTQSVEFLITYCAVHCANAIAVPLESKIPEAALLTIKQEVESCEFDETTYDILYTTGTTGKSKGVMLPVRALDACTENFLATMPFSEDLLFVISGPLNHIASLLKLHPTLNVGGAICILDGLRDVNTLFDTLNLPFKKFATFLVPASIHLLLQLAYDKLCQASDKISFIETGAAPITKQDMEQLCKALPNSRLYNTLGATEMGAVCTYDFNDGRHIEGCVGYPLKTSNVEISSEGNIIVSGKTLMLGYVGDEESTRKVLKDGKIHTSDLGYIDEEGMLHIRGREGDVINMGGFKVDPTEVESAAASHPEIQDCICNAATHPVIGTVLKLLAVPREGCEPNARTVARHIKSLLEPYKVPTYYEFVESIRRTYNGKLDRKFYKEPLSK